MNKENTVKSAVMSDEEFTSYLDRVRKDPLSVPRSETAALAARMTDEQLDRASEALRQSAANNLAAARETELYRRHKTGLHVVAEGKKATK